MKELLKELEIIVASEMRHSTDVEYFEFLKENEHLAAKLLNEIYYPQLVSQNAPITTARGGEGAYKQAIQNEPREGDIELVAKNFKEFLFQFKVPGDGWPNSKPFYQVEIKFNKDGTPSLRELDVQVRCDCPFFIYNGPEHNASVNNYLFDNPRGTASPPNIRDPGRQFYICKHIAAVFSLVDKKFRFPANYFRVPRS